MKLTRHQIIQVRWYGGADKNSAYRHSPRFCPHPLITADFNFDENEEYKQFFETTKDVNRIVQNLMLASGQKIMPEKTLIIFDEVQDCPKGINSMKYFCENAPQYRCANRVCTLRLIELGLIAAIYRNKSTSGFPIFLHPWDIYYINEGLRVIPGGRILYYGGISP